LPDAKIAWRDIWLGALLSAFLFTVGKYLIGWYLGRSSADSALGAGGSLVVLLIWVYYSSQIVLFGAEFSQVYANYQKAQASRQQDLSPSQSFMTFGRELIR
jgi:membrane protein